MVTFVILEPIIHQTKRGLTVTLMTLDCSFISQTVSLCWISEDVSAVFSLEKEVQMVKF